MGQDSVERYIGRILTDDLFRRDAARSFDKACAAEGFVFTGEERRALSALDHSLIERLSVRIDGGIKRSVAFVDFGGGMPPLGAGGEIDNSNKGLG